MRPRGVDAYLVALAAMFQFQCVECCINRIEQSGSTQILDSGQVATTR